MQRIDIVQLSGCILALIVVLSFAFGWLLLSGRVHRKRQWLMSLLLAGYIFMMMSYTVFCRYKGIYTQFFPVPFHNYAQNGLASICCEMLLNITMFVPVGFLLPLSIKKIHWCNILTFGLALSLLIEILQWTYKCGSCETNDLINNTLGCMAGYLLASWKIKRKQKQ